MSTELETTQVQEAQQTTETVAPKVSPFSDSAWKEKPIQDVNIQQPVQQQEQVSTATTTTTKEEDQLLDPNDWLKQRFGWENEELAKKEIEDLRKFREETEKAPKLKFTDVIKEREDDIYNYFSEKKRLEKIDKMDISKVDDAAEILKMNLFYKNKTQGVELTPEEVDFLFKKNFQLPAKPIQTEDMLDEDYERAVANWKQEVDLKERGMVIEAKLAKPEILKYKEGLTPPDIQLNAETAPTHQAPTPEELAAIEKSRNAYLLDVSKGLNDFNGFNATYKDEAVEIPISYNVTPEEKAALKPIMESLGQGWSYFENRWLNEDGSVNTAKMADDLYLLENKGKVIQKFTNETGSQVNLHRMKQKSNIQLNTDATRSTVPTEQATVLEKQIQAIWDA